MLGQDLGVVDGQELDERARSEGQIELHCQVVDLAHHLVGVGRRAVRLFRKLHYFHGNRVLAPQPGPPAPIARVAVAQHAVHHVIRVQRFAIGPLNPIVQPKRVLRSFGVDFPTLGQVSHHCGYVHVVKLNELVVKLRIGNHAGE